jgi:predicted nucleic acid-binding protein
LSIGAPAGPPALLDTSVILASLDPDEAAHSACDRLVAVGGHHLYVHALAEAFSILTGGARARKLDADTAFRLLDQSVMPFVRTVSLTGKDVLTALRDARARGVRGGAVYDYLHLVAARKAGVSRLVTLDQRHFHALVRPGDPRVEAP